MNFIDTNVLVQATAPTAPEHVRARTASGSVGSSANGAMSRQVLREYLSVATRPQPWADPLPLAGAMQRTVALIQMLVVYEAGPRVWTQLRLLAASHRFAGAQVHDANLVATMLTYGIERLLTFNTKHFCRFIPLIEVIEP